MGPPLGRHWKAPAEARECRADTFCLLPSPCHCRAPASLWGALIFWVTSVSPGKQCDVGRCHLTSHGHLQAFFSVTFQLPTSLPVWMVACLFWNNILVSSGDDKHERKATSAGNIQTLCASPAFRISPDCSCILVEGLESSATKTDFLLYHLPSWPLLGKEVQLL